VQVHVLIDLHAPELQPSGWNCTGRPEHIGATTVAVKYIISERVCWTIQQNQGDVAVRHFAASESVTFTYREFGCVQSHKRRRALTSEYVEISCRLRAIHMYMCQACLPIRP
jgi:hypothetical protein